MERAEDEPIDWSLTTWRGAEREQLRRWAELSLEEIVRAQEEMQDLADRLRRDATFAAEGSGPAAPRRGGVPADPTT
jgi:hypothetical protein